MIVNLIGLVTPVGTEVSPIDSSRRRPHGAKRRAARAAKPERHHRDTSRHDVFGSAEQVTAHTPPERRGLLAGLMPAEADRVRRFLIEKLQAPH